ncbi:MAG TPA: TetR/AcrR family transcriptional regulator [Acidimicrobiales bacterium]
MSDAREKLLESVIAELDRRGISQRSLRDIAAAVGTSHRMLIHHFGSRDGLLVAVVEAVEAGERQRSQVVAVPEGEHPADALVRTWRRLSAPRQAGRERLFFECYVRALQGEQPFSRLLPDAVTSWVEAASSPAIEAGRDGQRARAAARLGLAVVRGLLLDLLATGDRKGTTDALELFAASLRTPARR